MEDRIETLEKVCADPRLQVRPSIYPRLSVCTSIYLPFSLSLSLCVCVCVYTYEHPPPDHADQTPTNQPTNTTHPSFHTQNVQLYFADWGYSTPAQRERAFLNPRIRTVDLTEFACMCRALDPHR